MTEDEILGSLVPNVHVSRITLESSENHTLISTIQFVLKDRKLNDDISQWLTDNYTLEYLKVVVMQSTNENVTNTLIENQYRIADLLRTGQKLDLQDIIADNKQDVRFKILDLNTLNLGNIETTTESDGSQSLNIYLNTIFEDVYEINKYAEIKQAIPKTTPENPEHLSYIFAAFYDLSSFLNNTSIFQYGTNFVNDIIPFNMKIEKVISNGKLMTTSVIYMLEDGNIWPGEIHGTEINGQLVYRTGVIESPESLTLERVEIENIKVQDYRQIKNIIDSTKLESFSNLLSNINEIDMEEENLITKNSSISELFWSFDRKNNVSLTFFIDFKKMFLDNSLYGKKISKLNSDLSKKFINSFYNRASIERIALKNRKTNVGSCLSAYSEAVTVLELSGPNLKEAEKQVLFTIKGNSPQIKCFSISHPLSKNIGEYEYFIEIDYKDNILEIIEETLSLLKSEQKIYKQYYDFSILPNVFNTSTNTLKLNKLREFHLYRIIRNKKLLRTYLQNLIDAVYGIIYLDEDINVSLVSLEQLVTAVENHLNPANATPTSINYVVKLYDTIIDILSKLVFSTAHINNSLNEKGEVAVEKSKISNKSKIVTINKKFKNKVYINGSYKLEYLDLTLRDQDFYNTDSELRYELYKIQLTNDNLNFPQKINAKYDELSQKFEIFGKLNDILGFNSSLVIKDYSSGQKGKLFDLNLDPAKNALISPQNNLIDFRTSKINLIPGIGKCEDEKGEISEALKFERVRLNEFLLQLFDSSVGLGKSISINDLNSITYFNKIKTGVSIVNYPSNNNTDNLYIRNLLPETFIPGVLVRALPNQLKSLIKLRLENPLLQMNNSEASLKYEMLKQLKYLQGFEYDAKNGICLMNSPIWDMLQNYSLISDTGNNLFCSMVDYSNSKFKYTFNKILKKQVTNEHFFLTPQIHDNLNIIDGATRININYFETRALRENTKYFSNTEDVQIKISEIIINSSDSINNKKYSFLSPLGFHYEDNCRYFELNPDPLSFSLVQVSDKIQRTSIVDDKKQLISNFIARRNNKIINKNVLKKSLNLLTIYSRNE